jgi:hypothetical protein
MTHRVWISAIIALLAGLALGSWAPRADLKRIQKENEELRRKTNRQSAKSAEIGMITSMLKVPEKEPVKPVSKRRRHGPPFEVESAAPAATNAGTTADSHEIKTGRSQTMKQNIDAARELWETRAAMARNNFISNIKATPEQATNFEVIVEAMNLRLGTAIDSWAAVLKTQEVVQAEQGIRMMNDLSEIVVGTYDEMDGKMPEGWRANSGENFQLHDLIDPDVVTPLADLEGRFGPNPDRGFRRNSATNKNSSAGAAQ